MSASVDTNIKPNMKQLQIFIYTTNESRSDELELIIAFLEIYWNEFCIIEDFQAAIKLSKGQINPNGGFIVYVEDGQGNNKICKNIFDLTKLFDSEGLVPC